MAETTKGLRGRQKGKQGDMHYKAIMQYKAGSMVLSLKVFHMDDLYNLLISQRHEYVIKAKVFVDPR